MEKVKVQGEESANVILGGEDYLRSKYKNVVVDETFSITADKILAEFRDAGFDVVPYHIDEADFARWLEAANYETNYPRYVSAFKHIASGKNAVPQKKLQHYVSYKLLEMDEGVYVDVASSASCFPDIVKRFLPNVRVYRQDIEYKWGIHDDVIGSFASNIPLDPSSVDYMALHCSFEHFEGGEDFLFFKEAQRILVSGGKVCIIPLYMADEYVVQTSPDIWMSKYKVYEDVPIFDSRAKIDVRNSIKQRQSKFYSVGILKEELLDKYEKEFYIRIYYLENFREVEGASPFAAILEKR